MRVIAIAATAAAPLVSPLAAPAAQAAASCNTEDGRVPKLGLPLTRRELLRGSGILFGSIAAGSALALLAPSPAWAVELKTLSQADGAALMKLGRTLFPHDKLPDAVYALLAKDLDAAATADPATATLLRDGIAGLDNQADHIARQMTGTRDLSAAFDHQAHHQAHHQEPTMCEFFVKADPILYERRSRTVRIHGVLTSIRLENMVWDTLAEMAAAEGKSTNALIAAFHDEILAHRGEVPNFASFLRVTRMRYMKRQLSADGPPGTLLTLAANKPQMRAA